MTDMPGGHAASGGADLARTALAAARAAARTKSAAGSSKPKRLATVKRTGGRDPIGLGTALGAIANANGWDLQAKAGSITDRWHEIAPDELVDSVRPEHYDTERRVLHLRPATMAAASMLRWTGGQLAARINQKLGQDVIRSIKVLPPNQTGNRQLSMDNRTPAASDCRAITPAPVATGSPPSEEMQAWRTQYRDQRAAGSAQPPQPTSRWFEGVYGKLREPEAEHRNGVVAREEVEEQTRRSADSHLRALAVARSQRRTGDPAPLHRIEGAA
jgi:predicted nucleic acid-binding Zn ribbon protein